MKYLLIFALVGLLVFLWQAKRRANSSQRAPKTSNRPAALKTTDMVACAVCGVHLPRTEALALRQLSYCSEAHRLEAEHAGKNQGDGRGNPPDAKP